MKEENYHLALDKREQGVILKSLNELRNTLIEKKIDTIDVDELIVKTYHAPKKKFKIVEKDSYDER